MPTNQFSVTVPVAPDQIPEHYESLYEVATGLWNNASAHTSSRRDALRFMFKQMVQMFDKPELSYLSEGNAILDCPKIERAIKAINETLTEFAQDPDKVIQLEGHDQPASHYYPPEMLIQEKELVIRLSTDNGEIPLTIPLDEATTIWRDRSGDGDMISYLIWALRAHQKVLAFAKQEGKHVMYANML